jgi:2-methylcitrate dehydratase
MVVVEEPQYTRDYLDPEKRSIAGAVQLFFKDGSCTEKVAVEYPLGHRRRRAEGIPLLIDKFAANLASRLAPARCKEIMSLCLDADLLQSTPVDRFMDMFVIGSS